MPYDLDLEDRDFRHDLSPEQLEALERRRVAELEPRAEVRRPLRLVGADRPVIDALRKGGG